MTPALSITVNALGLYGLAAILIAAFAFQFAHHELPCPLCLLQRLQFAALAIGPILNVRYGPRPSHYALSLIAAVMGAVFAMRQILLHIMPGDPGYGSAFLGYHYYTWAFLLFAIAIVLIALMLLFDRQFAPVAAVPLPQETPAPPPYGGAFAAAAVWLVIALTLLNAVDTLLICGFGECPDNPVHYELLQGARR